MNSLFHSSTTPVLQKRFSNFFCNRYLCYGLWLLCLCTFQKTVYYQHLQTWRLWSCNPLFTSSLLATLWIFTTHHNSALSIMVTFLLKILFQLWLTCEQFLNISLTMYLDSIICKQTVYLLYYPSEGLMASFLCCQVR